MNIEKQNEPYIKKESSREIELKRFLMRTSNDLNNIVGDEVESFAE
jgi:hypothetical protein